MVLHLMKQIEPYSLRPWRLFEVYPTSDGYRSRVCNGAWETEEEARKVMKEKEADRVRG